MKIADKDALKELKRVKSFDLDEDMQSYPEDERDGRSDMQILADEVSYILSCYTEDGHVFCEALEMAKETIKETKNGKVIPFWSSSLKPKYRPSDIENARNIINEHKRLKSCMKRLNEKGFYGKW